MNLLKLQHFIIIIDSNDIYLFVYSFKIQHNIFYYWYQQVLYCV